MKAQQARGAQRDHFARLSAALHEGALELSSDGDVLAVNDRFCDMVGFSRAEVLGAARPFPWVARDGWHESDEVLMEVLLSGAEIQAELELSHRDGARFPVLLTTRRLDWSN